MHSAVNTAECLLSWVISNWRFCFETTQDYIQLNTSKNLSLLARALSETPLVHGQHSQIFGGMEARHINKLRLLQQPPLPSRPNFPPNSKVYRSSVIFRMHILILHSNNPILLQSDIPRKTGPSQGWHDPWPRSPGVQIMWSNSRCCLHTSTFKHFKTLNIFLIHNCIGSHTNCFMSLLGQSSVTTNFEKTLHKITSQIQLEWHTCTSLLLKCLNLLYTFFTLNPDTSWHIPTHHDTYLHIRCPVSKPIQNSKMSVAGDSATSNLWHADKLVQLLVDIWRWLVFTI